MKVKITLSLAEVAEAIKPLLAKLPLSTVALCVTLSDEGPAP